MQFSGNQAPDKCKNREKTIENVQRVHHAEHLAFHQQFRYTFLQGIDENTWELRKDVEEIRRKWTEIKCTEMKTKRNAQESIQLASYSEAKLQIDSELCIKIICSTGKKDNEK